MTLFGCRDRGDFPNYHTPEDSAGNVDCDAAWNVVAFAWRVLFRFCERLKENCARLSTRPLNPQMISFIIPAHKKEAWVVMWAAATSWLGAQAILNLWEVATGICHPPSIARDFPRSPSLT